jgi:cation diffusion facilitator family transporter
VSVSASPPSLQQLRRPILFSLLAALLTMALKTIAYLYTDSLGLLSDAAETTVNFLAAGTAWVSLWYAAKPVDVEHTYGHRKIEYFSAGLEGVLIVAAAVGIAWYAVWRLVTPASLHEPLVGAAVALAASAINLAVAICLLRFGRRFGSIVLEADGHHLMADVITSLCVVAGLVLVKATGWERLDPVVALLVAVYIVRTGWRLIARSFNGLMDHALPPAEQTLVRKAIESQLGPEAAYHAIRTRQAGTDRFVDFHLLVPGKTDVAHAHRLAVRVEQAVRQALPGTEVVIHIEPIEEKASWEDSELLAIERDQKNPG